MKSLRNSAERSFSVWEQVVLRWCPFRCFLIASTPTTGAERTPTAGPTGTKTGQKITPVITRNFFILGSNGKHIRPGRISRGRKSSTSPWFPLSTRSMSRNSLSNSWKPLSNWASSSARAWEKTFSVLSHIWRVDLNRCSMHLLNASFIFEKFWPSSVLGRSSSVHLKNFPLNCSVCRYDVSFVCAWFT